MAFESLDREYKGYITQNDFRNFLKSTNMYPSEKCMKLFFLRLDKDEDSLVSYDEFVTGFTPLQV